MLCTKSPNKLRYADNLEGPPVEFSGFTSSSPSGLPRFLDRRPFCAVEGSTPDAWEISGSEWGCECEWVCPAGKSSFPSTRSVFSMMKNEANPTKIPSLTQWWILWKCDRKGVYPIKMFRFSSTITKCTPASWCSPMKAWGIKCRKTSESRPPVCTTFQRVRVY